MRKKTPTTAAPSSRSRRQRPTGNRRTGEHRWLLNQLNDPYTKRAKQEGYRARSAYKLDFIQNKYHLIKQGDTVIDLGAAPGSWSQAVSGWVGSSGRTIAIDKAPLDTISGVQIIQGDILNSDSVAQILSLTGNAKVDVVLSDMAPAASGIADAHAAAHAELLHATFNICEQLLRAGGNLCCKVFAGNDADELIRAYRQCFRWQRRVRPPAVKRASTEYYFVGMGWHEQA